MEEFSPLIGLQIPFSRIMIQVLTNRRMQNLTWASSTARTRAPWASSALCKAICWPMVTSRWQARASTQMAPRKAIKKWRSSSTTNGPCTQIWPNACFISKRLASFFKKSSNHRWLTKTSAFRLPLRAILPVGVDKLRMTSCPQATKCPLLGTWQKAISTKCLLKSTKETLNRCKKKRPVWLTSKYSVTDLRPRRKSKALRTKSYTKSSTFKIQPRTQAKQ